MNLRMRQTSVLNIWPAFTDVAIAMLLIFLFFLFIQFIANSKLILKIRMEKKQETIQEAFAKKFAAEIANGTITIERDGNLQRFSFSDRILFKTAEAELQPLGQTTLTAVGRLLQRYKTNAKGQRLYQSVQINGHTDNIPIETEQFPSNWELSSARAIAVLRLFISDEVGIDARTLIATGYGEYHPVATNWTKVGRAKNRRIEIVLVYSETEGGK